MKRAGWVMLAVFAFADVAAARTADGRLDMLIAPHNAAPALTSPGGVFEIVATKQEPLCLVGPLGATPLDVTWKRMPDGRMRGQGSVPPGTPPGAYALQSGDPQVPSDVNVRAVYVFDSFPETYVLAHIGDAAPASSNAGKASLDGLRQTLTAVQASGAVLVFITGNVSTDGSSTSLARFLETLDTCALPTFVAPGERDYPAAAAYFRRDAYAVRFGQDGFLVFDTADYPPAPDMGGQNGDIERLRRALKPCRWSIGVTFRYVLTMGMRTQLALFVDAPLDGLLATGNLAGPDAPPESMRRVPWGSTLLLTAPSAENGRFRLIQASPVALRSAP
ncbi:MAG TPA: hypothetical protein PLO62_11495 [Candidatus Hydrogenedentes bacterium]|nr:hypothetical protein [Candidatus Hydrogenedentota bacterium]HOS01976.1 hypothetical protein [Candidatus Hydrogenedentota bacterium]